MWGSAAQDDEVNTRVRELYRDLYAETGGVPVPNEYNDGSYINYPDADLADPALEHLRRAVDHAVLQGQLPTPAAGQERYDPRNTFRHRLSIELPD